MVKVRHNQSLIDIVIQENGQISSLFDYALDNEISITNDLEIGSEIKPIDKSKDNLIVDFYKVKKQNPAFALDNETRQIVKKRGIGFMRIGNTFKVG